jgi:plasmid stabilization system protein ParE
MADLIWQPGALEDLDGVAERIALDSVHYAKLQVSRVFTAAEVLKRYPAIGHPVPEWSNVRLKELHVGDLRVIYHLVNARVDVLAVVHMKRRLSRRTLQRRAGSMR